MVIFAPGLKFSDRGGSTDGSWAGTWTQKASLPVARAEVGVAALDGQVFVIGGIEQADQGPPRSASTSTMACDPASNTWQNRAPLPQALSHGGVAAPDGERYAGGGFVEVVHIGPQNGVFDYYSGADQWSELPDSSSPLGSTKVAAVGGKIHIFGGCKSDRIVRISPPGAPDLFAGFGTVRTHKIYDPKSGSWSPEASIPGAARNHMGTAFVNMVRVRREYQRVGQRFVDSLQ
jgi:Kelch motif